MAKIDLYLSELEFFLPLISEVFNYIKILFPENFPLYPNFPYIRFPYKRSRLYYVTQNINLASKIGEKSGSSSILFATYGIVAGVTMLNPTKHNFKVVPSHNHSAKYPLKVILALEYRLLLYELDRQGCAR